MAISLRREGRGKARCPHGFVLALVPKGLLLSVHASWAACCRVLLLSERVDILRRMWFEHHWHSLGGRRQRYPPNPDPPSEPLPSTLQTPSNDRAWTTSLPAQSPTTPTRASRFALRLAVGVRSTSPSVAPLARRKADHSVLFLSSLKSWITWFLSTKGNEYFSEVDEEYILDRFNLTGLNAEVPQEYGRALELITDSLGESLPPPLFLEHKDGRRCQEGSANCAMVVQEAKLRLGSRSGREDDAADQVAEAELRTTVQELAPHRVPLTDTSVFLYGS